MGTRGAVGFYRNGKDRITYNHFDSYPDHLGRVVIEFVQQTSVQEMHEIFDNIVLVKDTYLEGFRARVDMDAGTQPTPEQIAEVKALFVNQDSRLREVKVSTGTDQEWYSLLREAQGDLSAYKRGLKYMMDSHEFMSDSLFNEWAYILNLDTEVLEFYRGFNTDVSQESSRYKSENPRSGVPGEVFYAVRLAAEFEFSYIRMSDVDALVAKMTVIGDGDIGSSTVWEVK